MELRQHFNDEPGAAGEMTIRFDPSTGRTRSHGAGFWSVRQATDYFADWRAIVRDIHSRGLSLHAIVDLREAQVQSNDVAAVIGSVTAEIYRTGDHIAMIVPTSLAKMQMRRVLDARYHEFFVSPDAADLWLDGKAGSARLRPTPPSP
jgi:hypothetical protein